MRDVNEDSEYRQLKDQIKRKEIASYVWTAVAGVALIGAIVFAFGGLPIAAVGGKVFAVELATVNYLAAGASAVVAAFSGYRAFRIGQDIRFDTEEMRARRDADNLGRAMSQVRSPEEQVVMAHMMGKRRDEERRKEEEQKKAETAKKWVDIITPGPSGLTQER
jgi:hypothetical protein